MAALWLAVALPLRAGGQALLPYLLPFYGVGKCGAFQSPDWSVPNACDCDPDYGSCAYLWPSCLVQWPIGLFCRGRGGVADRRALVSSNKDPAFNLKALRQP